MRFLPACFNVQEKYNTFAALKKTAGKWL